jgi:FixJ family two-component response regulator
MASRRPRIAIVDDDPTVAVALRRLCRASDLDADTFSSGRAFLDSLPDERPDCVVLDLHMPGMNGLDVLRQLARVLPALPVIIITGHDDPSSRARCAAEGARGYLAKPVSDETLLQAIADAIAVARGGNGTGDRA